MHTRADEIHRLREREKELGIEPDWEIDAFMKASAARGKRNSIMTDYTMRILGLEVDALFHPGLHKPCISPLVWKRV